MKLLRTYIFIPLITVAYFSEAQTGSLSGKVIDDSSRYFPHAIIQLKGTSYQATSSEDGSFRIENIKPGSYRLICNNSLEKKIDIEADKETYLLLQVQHKAKELDEVVVTATRTEKDISEVPIPIKVITGEQIRQMGSLRLNEVLMEQTGLAIVTDQSSGGAGIQLQGFNPDYTLILLDGEPLIGRTSGTFDLTRVAIGNIKRIEIVKGPSSSLYGSEALAGVINIITEKPKENFLSNAKIRYGTNNTTDLNADAYMRFKKLGIYAFGNRYSTSGYDLQPQSEDKTVAPFQNYTFQSKLSYAFNSRWDLSLSGRYFSESFNTIITFTDESNVLYRVNDKGGQYDWNINPVLTYRMNERNKLITRFYSTSYHTHDFMTHVSDGSFYDQSYFNQSFSRPEIQFNHVWKKNQQTTVGGGTTIESVDATRYTEKKYFYNVYAYLQHDFVLLKRLNIIAGARMDRHSVYGSQLSPKLSSKLKITEWLSLRASVGKGFKAPDFRQLYLNFTNPVVGYSVFGSQEIAFQFYKLEQQNAINQILIDPASLQPIKAESSTAYNIGWILQPTKKITWQVNFFRNDITNMIETSPIAIKTNGQSIYTYFNLSSVYTQGLETDLSYKITNSLTFSAGYQYLEAKNKAVISDIENGKYFTRDPATLAARRLSIADYGGLFNRSKHMANVKLFYMNKNGWGANIRGIYRGRYGFGDLNGNLILDDDREYVNGYWIWNVAASKKIFNMMTLQFGIDNVFGFINAQYIPSVPGRLYYMSLNMNLNKKP